MFQDDTRSTPDVPSPFLPPQDIQKNPKVLIDYALGGVAIQNPSQGLQVQTWKCEVIGDDVIVSAPSVAPTVIYSEPGITDISFTFDQNMQPFIAYMVNYETCKFRWFDGTISQFVITTLPTGSFSPRCKLDDTRSIANTFGWNDIIVTYIRGGNIYFRKQRDRYTVEYLFASGFNFHVLGNFGMNMKYRLQWQVIPLVLLPGVPTLLSLTPNSAIEGSGAQQIVLNGSGFDTTSKAKWDGVIRDTHYDSPTKLRMDLLASDLLVVGPHNVSVLTPLPGGGASGNVTFTVIGTYLFLTEEGDTFITETGDNFVTQEAP